MHPDLKEKLAEIYGNTNVEYLKLNLLVDSVNEILMNLEYEVCINKKLATHFLNEYTLTNDLLTKSKLRCLELEVINNKLQNNM